MRLEPCITRETNMSVAAFQIRKNQYLSGFRSSVCPRSPARPFGLPLEGYLIPFGSGLPTPVRATDPVLEGYAITSA